MHSPLDPTHLIECLFSGLGGRSSWRMFLDRLRNIIHADYASIVFQSLSSDELQKQVACIYSGEQSVPLISEHCWGGLSLEDLAPYFTMHEGRVYTLDELHGSGSAHREYCQARFFGRSGMVRLHVMRIQEAGGINAWINIARHGEDMSSEQIVLLGRLAPFIRAALASQVALERERSRTSVASEAFRRMNVGWLVLDATGYIIDADSYAEQILSTSGQIYRSSNGRVGVQSKETEGYVKQSIKEMGGKADSTPRAIAISHNPWLDMLLVSAPNQDSSIGRTPVLFAYLHADRWASANCRDQLCQLFDLLPSEARVALALTRGMSLNEAAKELRLSLDTVRTYSKRIYAKTGARGQTDLVRFVYRSVLSLA